MTELDLSAPGVAKKVAAEVLSDIDAAAVKLYQDGPRSHLGASIIGEACHRKLWLAFRWTKNIQHAGRQLRLFNRGHREEERFTEWLTTAGYRVINIDPATGKQWRIEAVNGHFGGSQDGEVWLPAKFNYNKPILLEYKTNCTGAAFTKLLDSGVAVGKPVHTDQMDSYGFVKGYEYALYLNVCKNDDNIHSEIYKIDNARGKKLQEKAKVIILSQVAPPRIAENPASKDCKFCGLVEVCHFREPAELNCRSCENCKPIENKQWFCNKWNAAIPPEAIAKGCDSWVSIYRS